MMARADLAAERTALTSRACFEEIPARGWEPIDDGHATRPSELSQCRVVRMREQVSALLAQMPDDVSGGATVAGDDPASDEAAEAPGRSDGFWAPDGDPAPTSGYKSKHRLAGPPKEHGARDGHSGKPRHAAPPASLVSVIGRRLAGLRLTGYCAAHAA